MDATVVIATRSRREELRVALASLRGQEAVLQVIVSDDGSTDGTAEMVANEFPEVEVLRSETSRGQLVARNAAAERAQADAIVFLDDDVALPSPRTIAQAVADLAPERVGATSIPVIDVPRGGAVVQRAPDGERVWVTWYFIAAGCAFRTEAFRAVGGWLERLRRGAEEPDIVLRLLRAGWATRLGTADPIEHYESPKRSNEELWYHTVRNDVLHTWHSVPMPALAGRLGKVTVHNLWLGRGVGRTGFFAKALWDGWRALPSAPPREPLSRELYRAVGRMRAAPVPLEEVLPLLEQ